MADMQLNMRVTEEVAERFRAFCKEQGVSQPQGMDSLLSMMELVKAKEAIPSRQTDIESFEMHTKALMDAFLHSLEINAEAEERVKAQFISSLESKDKTIVDLQGKVEALQTMLAEAQSAQQNSENRAVEAEKETAAAIEAAESAQRTATDKAAIIEMLTSKLQEAESKLGGYDALQADEQAAKAEIGQLKEQLKEAQYAVKSAEMEAQLQIAKEREQLERAHSAEIKALYEKMSAYQEQIAALTAPKPEKEPEKKEKTTTEPEPKKG